MFVFLAGDEVEERHSRQHELEDAGGLQGRVQHVSPWNNQQGALLLPNNIYIDVCQTCRGT
jgi:hypothetical protein